MPSKRAQVPPDVLTKRPTALDKLTGVVPETDTTPAQTAPPMAGSAEVAQSVRRGKGAGEKTTFYLRPDQLDKLDELVGAYKRQTGQRRGVNRNDIVRQLIDRADLSSLLDDVPRGRA